MNPKPLVVSFRIRFHSSFSVYLTPCHSRFPQALARCTTSPRFVMEDDGPERNVRLRSSGRVAFSAGGSDGGESSQSAPPASPGVVLPIWSSGKVPAKESEPATLQVSSVEEPKQLTNHADSPGSPQSGQSCQHDCSVVLLDQCWLKLRLVLVS